jgi:hypothetical protein
MLRIIDYTGEVHTHLHRLLDGLSALEALKMSDSCQPREALLLRALREVYQLRQFAQLEARPLPGAGDLFHTDRLRQMDQSSNAPVVRSTTNPSANYLPWLQGKINTVERCLYTVCELSDSLTAHTAARPSASHAQAAREHWYMAMYSARQSLEDMTDLIEAGILKIQHVVRAT